MSEPVAIGRWTVAGVVLKTRQGNRGAVPHNDRKLYVNGVPINFEEYLTAVATERWTQELEGAVRRFFYCNEDAIWPRPKYQGARMLQQAEVILREEGLNAALRYVKGTKKSPEARGRGRRGPCARCGTWDDRGRTPGAPDDVLVCLPCHLSVA